VVEPSQSARDAEQAAWDWLDDMVASICDEEPADIVYSAYQMVDAFMAGGADDCAICPACSGSGEAVADTICGFCGGSGGVPVAVAASFHYTQIPNLAATKPAHGLTVDILKTAFKGAGLGFMGVQIERLHAEIISAIRSAALAELIADTCDHPEPENDHAQD
jgi:hypothetical protein